MWKLADPGRAAAPPREADPTPTLDAAPGDAGPLARLAFGRALDAQVRARFEPALGVDLSRVRVHDDARGAAEAQARRARALTFGEDIAFARGAFRPGTDEGDALLAHELAHAAQQRRGGTGAAGAALEADADTSARAALAGVDARPALGSGPALAAAEDWTFTPAKYAALVKAKKDLSFGPDSDWFPQKLKDNLVATLKVLLTSTAKPAPTTGVSVQDFYHGHVGVPKGARGGDLQTKMSAFFAGEEKAKKKALGGESFNPVTAANLPAFKKAWETEIRPLAKDVLDEAVKVKGAVVIYHTLEGNMPSGMKPGSPTRNWKTPLDGNTPAPYTPPDEKSASSWMNEFDSVFQFAFLVDQDGVIHVRSGTTSDLSTVTGTPLP